MPCSLQFANCVENVHCKTSSSFAKIRAIVCTRLPSVAMPCSLQFANCIKNVHCKTSNSFAKILAIVGTRLPFVATAKNWLLDVVCAKPSTKFAVFELRLLRKKLTVQKKLRRAVCCKLRKQKLIVAVC